MSIPNARVRMASLASTLARDIAIRLEQPLLQERDAEVAHVPLEFIERLFVLVRERFRRFTSGGGLRKQLEDLSPGRVETVVAARPQIEDDHLPRECAMDNVRGNADRRIEQ